MGLVVTGAAEVADGDGDDGDDAGTLPGAGTGRLLLETVTTGLAAVGGLAGVRVARTTTVATIVVRTTADRRPSASGQRRRP